MNYLKELEAEAIYAIREAYGQFNRAAILFSGGKDSVVLAHLCRLAFAPAPSPFPLLHIDTGHNFDETLEYRDWFAREFGFELRVAKVQDSIDQGRAVEETGPNPSRNAIQSITLLDAIAAMKLDAVFGGGRRDEEKARAKERVFSHRDSYGHWKPREQRPELWNLYNGNKHHGEHFRVFPLSNWTELDVWEYIHARQFEMPNLYYSHSRKVVIRPNAMLAYTPYITVMPQDRVETRQIRFRTIGDATCTGAVDSTASNVNEVLEELRTCRWSERSTRADDQRSENAMEDRKRQGYF